MSRGALAHRNLLIAFTRYLQQGRGGGLMNAAVEMLVKVLPLRGALAFRCDDDELALVGDHRLPLQAKRWITHLAYSDDGWFVAQHVAHRLKPAVDDLQGVALARHPVRPLLEEAGWRALAGAPIAVGRDLRGVLVLAAPSTAVFDADTLMVLETICSLIALAEDRERILQRERDSQRKETTAGRLATVGLLTSTAACDMAAPLAALQVQLDQQETALAALRGKLETVAGNRALQLADELEDLAELSESMAAGVRTAQGVASRLMGFSRESPREALDFNEIVHMAAGMLHGSFETAGIALTVEGDDQLAVHGRASSLQLLVVQLLVFARQECENARTKGRRIRVRLSSEGVRHVLTVETDAVERANAHVFDAYVSRKKGTEAVIGLALARKTVVAHDGHIEHGQSELGGTLIRVVLPAAAREIEQRRQPAPRPPQSGGYQGPPRLVVWIDPDEETTRTARNSLRPHEVLAARSLAEAYQILSKLHDEPATIFCDVGLPDGNAIELHQRLDGSLADKVVWMTGGVLPTEAARYLVSSGRPTLIKPLSGDEIREHVEGGRHERLSELPTLRPPVDPAPPSSRSAERMPRLSGSTPSKRWEQRRQAATVEESPAAKTQRGK